MSRMAFRIVLAAVVSGTSAAPLRAPAYPLIVHDSFFSTWARGDDLPSTQASFWGGVDLSWLGAVRVDRRVFQWLGGGTGEARPSLGSLPPLGSTINLAALLQPGSSFRHCDAQGFVTPTLVGDEDHIFRLVAALNGATNAVSFQSTNFPAWYIAPISTAEAGRLGVVQDPTADDASWLPAPVADIGLTFSSLSATPAYTGQLMSIVSALTGSCAGQYTPPSGNAALTAGDVANATANQTWTLVTVAPPPLVLPPVRQVGLPVTSATQTSYMFMAGPSQQEVQLNITFTTPVRGDALRTWQTSPVSFITASAVSVDGYPHDVQVLFSMGADLVTESQATTVEWGRATDAGPGAAAVRIGSSAQDVFGTRGDARRITWGHQYLATPVQPSPSGVSAQCCVANFSAIFSAFTAGEPLPSDEPYSSPRPAGDGVLTLASVLDFGTLPAIPPAQPSSSFISLSMDEVASVQYYGTALAPVWTAKGNRSMGNVLSGALTQYASTVSACSAFDAKLAQDASRVGGGKYADLVSLAHRQVFGAVVFVSPPSTSPPACVDTLASPSLSTWAFMEEQSSDGDVSTVDVLYPASPAILFFSPTLMWQLMSPVFDYAASCTPTPYGLAWAPHDLGTWPVADKTPDEQEQMPLEESGNMLILSAAVAQLLGNVSHILPHHWGLLSQWAAFANASLPYPPSQLCTDDFEGPAPNNTNLAIKGIVGLGAYAQLLTAKGDSAGAAAYSSLATQLASTWCVQALSSDGTHYRRQYELNDTTFSLKYNTLYDFFLGTGLFPGDTVMDKEFRYYIDVQGETYGTPLDDRNTFTLVEYLGALTGVAGMMPNGTYQTYLVDALWGYANTTVQRVPMTDWYQAGTAAQVGFQARATVGDLFALLLINQRQFT